MSDYQKLEWIHCAIQEAQNGNNDMLTEALGMVEDLREPYYKQGICRAIYVKESKEDE